MGGRVWVDETPGGGATFMIEIPDAELPGQGQQQQPDTWPDQGVYAAGAWG